MNKRLILRGLTLAVVGAGLNLMFINAAPSQSEELLSKGLNPITPEETAKLEKRKITKVRPNKLAFDRANKERGAKHLSPIPVPKQLDNEVDVVDTTGGAVGATSSTTTTTTTALGAVPAQVDNSTLNAFPPIGNQGSLPSCVAWASTYYMMSHQYCLATGCDNRNLRQKIFSPKWTYNFINGGAAQGTYFSDALSVIANHGAALLSEFPYDSNYLAWDLNSAHWKNAISARMTNYSSGDVSTDTGIANTKQLLANGNVVIFGTYISSWVYGTVGVDPTVSSPFAGQKAVKYQNGTSGGHAMTIVGYDDSIWIDLNGNGVVDQGEKGAFKIANSWGTSYGNAGFVWAAYDAFKTTSSVAGFAPTGRIKLTQTGSYYLVNWANKTPKALAKVNAAHLYRNQMSFQLGGSSTSVTSPQVSFGLPATSYHGGAHSFDGLSAEVSATFYFDASDVTVNSDPANTLYYLTAFDSTSGNSLYLGQFDIVDPVTDAVISSSTKVPATVDATSLRVIAGNYTADTQAPTVPSSVTASLVSKKSGRNTNVSVSVKWAASTDNVAVAKYAIYRNGVKYAESTTTSFSDASTVVGNTYVYQISAIDTSGNTSALSLSVSIKR